MNDNVQLTLLKIIKFNGDVIPLVKMGYEYSQIGQLINNSLGDGLAQRINGSLVLTEKGNDLMQALLKKLGRKNTDKWIEPEHHSKISKIEINDIFLPSQDDLSF